MLLLITIGLVLVAAVTLLIGIFSNSLPLIYVSIASSFLAAIVLVVLSQISRRGREVAPAPAREGAPAPEREPAPVPAGVGATPTRAAEPTPAPAAAPTPTASGHPFPINAYDDLTVGEILPRLDDLNADQLDIVAEREETTKNRSSILNRIDELLDALEEGDLEAEEEVEDERLVPSAAGVSSERFPIDDYDDLAVSEILAQLGDLDAEELDIVAEREETGKNRVSILNRIDERLDEIEGVAPAPAPVKRKAAKKKAAAKKAPAKKKAATKKAATKKAPARKRAATKKAATKKAPGKKKAATKKAAGKKKAASKKKAAAKRRG